MSCGIAREGAFLQNWESNRSVRMENVGDADIVNPWLSNGRNHFRRPPGVLRLALAVGGQRIGVEQGSGRRERASSGLRRVTHGSQEAGHDQQN